VIDIVRKHIASSEHEQVKCVSAFLMGTVVAFNEDTHRLVAKGRVVPVLVECIKATCDETACELNFKDFRDKDVCDHSAALLRNLSHNSAQHNLLASLWVRGGAPERDGQVSPSAVRINSACAVANLVGREESGRAAGGGSDHHRGGASRCSRRRWTAKKSAGINYTVWKMVQGIANLATLDIEQEAHRHEAGALPMLVRCLQERQEEWDKAVFWSVYGALWNLAFRRGDQGCENRTQEPGALDALEEAKRRLGIGRTPR